MPQPLGELGGSSGRETWPAAATRVGVEGELGDDEGGPASLQEGSVRAALGISEDAQLGGPPGEIVGDRLGIVGTHAEQDDQAVADLPDGLTVHADLAASDSLQ